MNDRHYQKLIYKKKRTKLISCGYIDRFDPYTLNKNSDLRKLYAGLFNSYLKDIPCDRLLDIGCGTGIYFDVLAHCSDNIEAIDVSGEMIQVAREYCQTNGLTNIHPRTGSAELLDYEDESFDVVIELDVLHHVSNLGKALTEIHRVLKTGGYFLVFEPNICNPLMFIAHLVPIEERLALGRNRPGKLVGLLEERFKTIQWDGVCALVTQTKGIKRFLLDMYIDLWKLCGLKRFYPRQVWFGVKT